METFTYYTANEAETEDVGFALAERLTKEGRLYAFIALYGEMGVGKTAFTRGFCRALGIASVHSPTYTVVNEYTEGKIPVFHFDMYRIESAEDLYSIGFEDYLARDGYALSEWSENITPYLPSDAISVTVARENAGTKRKITVLWQ